MELNTHKNAVLNTAVLLLLAAGVFAVARYAHSLAGQVAAVFIAFGFVVALVSWFQMRLEERERLERLEFDELTKGPSSGALFNEDESEVFPARRSREQFERFFIPGLTVLLLLMQAVSAWLLWQSLHKVARLPLHQPAVALSFFGVFFLILFLLGRYSAGIARLKKDRLLRPSANHLLLSAYACGVVALTIVAAWADFPVVDYYAALGGVILLALIAFETLLGLVLELYRPRVKGKAARLLYESRLVGLFSHPEGLFSTAAHVLDYQFGFKVSDTWFYKFLERNFPLLVAFQLAILLLSSCVVFIEAGEQGLLERFGRPVAGRNVIGPGLHVKWFWPVDRVQRFRTDQIQTFDVGFVHEEKNNERPHEEVVLWTVAHYKEEFNLLVASRDTGAVTNASDGKRIPPVNLLSVSIPVQFQINDVQAWAYNHLQPAKLLAEVGTREVVRYLVGVDLMEFMSTGRFKAAEELRDRIQKQADDLKLGVRIVFLGMQDVHPPVSVAGSYEAVIGAEQKRQADILKASADAVGTNAWSEAEALRKEREAEADRERRAMTAEAESGQFANRMSAYRAEPDVYKNLARLEALSRYSAGTRKIIVAATNTEPFPIFDLGEKIRPDLLGLPMPTTKPR
jgi:regulator of protease activity HflC (stomatin/prohibitin superfamily)